MPWYVTVAFLVWLVVCICSIAFSKRKDKKWYRKSAPSFIMTLFFTILFFTAIDTDHFMFDDKDISFWVVAPSFSLPTFYFIGIWLNRKWQVKQEAKRQHYNRIVDQQIRDKFREIQRLNQSVRDRALITHFVNMLECCGEDVSQISSDPRISNMAKITSDIRKYQKEIQHLQSKKM